MWWMLGLFLCSWIGAKVLFIFTQDRWAMGDLAQAGNFWLGGGFVFLGGLLGGGLFTLIVGSVWKHLSFKKMDFTIAPLLWGHALGRVGCFLAGCCFGQQTTVPWAIHLHGYSRHPTQLYEAVALALLAYLIQSKRFKSYQAQGYLVSYGLIRWVIENYRGDELRGSWAGQSTSQWISLVLMVTGLAWLAMQHLKTTGAASKTVK
jgi:phosphatidylglycerol:prolipoprotein diacylglycerol transferase